MERLRGPPPIVTGVRRILPAALLASLALAACGGDDDGGASAEPPDLGEVSSTVDVVAEDISFPQDMYEATAGRVGFVYTNEGQILHTLVIEDPADDDEVLPGLDLAVNSNGDVDSGAIELEPGTYTIFCDIPGHRAAGMVADLEVAP